MQPVPDHQAAPGYPDDTDVPATGIPAVDAVLASLEALDDRPVDEHVQVFERAHDELRRTLDTPGTAGNA